MRGIGGLVAAGLLAMLSAAVLSAAAADEMRLSPRKIQDEVKAVVEAQIAALQAGDFSAAYAHAALGIKRQFSERVFALMIRRGYAPLLRAEQVDVGLVRDDGQDLAQVLVTVTDAAGRSTVYRYWLELEEPGWRISGVMLEQRPPRGDV
ncbi:MAG: DUF4864 domain-containing protein [Opitutaceae bacterium]|nr:DUF4864 domain-containing protein [Opitutaceae bacterium]